MAYLRKNRIGDISPKQRNPFFKTLSLIILGASVSLFLVNADLIINPQISNSIAYIKQFFVTSDWTASGTLGVTLNSSGVFATKYCDLSWSNCKTITELNDISAQLWSLSSLYLTWAQVDDKISNFSLWYLPLNYYNKIGVDVLISQATEASRNYLTGNYYDKTDIDTKWYLTWAQVDDKISNFSGTLNTLAKTPLTCSPWQVVKIVNGNWACADDLIGSQQSLAGYALESRVITELQWYLPSSTNLDPKIGTISTSGKWCTSDGIQITCTKNDPTTTAEPLWIAASGNYYTNTYINTNYYTKTTINDMFRNTPFFTPNTYGCGTWYITQLNWSSVWQCVSPTSISVSKLLINSGTASELYGSDTCSGVNEWAIRYNQTDKVFEGCDWDFWFMFSGSTHPDA